MKQPPYPAGSHDSIQYHFFCDDKLFAARIFRTDTLENTSAWIFDGSARSILDDGTPIKQSSSDHLDVTAATISMNAGEGEGRLSIRGAKPEDSFEVEFTSGKEFRWSDTLEDVLHQPDLRCVVKYKGKLLAGRGYCKRYAWAKPPHYWGYRFLQGFLDDRETAIWTADAVFGENKYDYFKIVSRDGTLLEAPKESCAHKQNTMFGYRDGVRHQADFEELGVWNHILKSSGMDSHLQQRYGKVRYFDGQNYHEGVAITEYCFGTLG